MENTNVVVFTVLLSVCYMVNTEPPCARGEKGHTSQYGLVDCLMCERGTYMPENEHTYQRCFNCTRIENPDVEVLVVACNRFHDAVILCTNGHYRYTAQAPDERDRCEKCSQCPIPEHERGCQGYSNTVCCNPVEGTGTARDGEVLCKKESVVCGPGQFLRTSTDECSPCPAETFMSDHNHVNKKCLQCEQLSENTATHGIIIRPCTRTAPTLFGCEDGYFRDPTQESSQKEVSCTPCRSCDKSLLDCGMFHDVVCVDQDPVTSAAPSDLTQSIGNGQESKHCANDTLTNVPECDRVSQVNTLLVSGTLLFFILSLMSSFKLALGRAETSFHWRQLSGDACKLWLQNYLSMFIALVSYVVLSALLCYGVFCAFAQDYIYACVAGVSVITAICFYLYLFCPNFIKVCLKTCWDKVCSAIQRRQIGISDRWFYTKTSVDNTQN
ncbi:unnamed protein product [Candidula unifasciata]|uniref:TNFR-Cys domain-containing protein n=1 Tax=Candidula unifasciata TaxID=100452 RepID=A0A8S4A4L7_9EUPU|nr:unnamed protein product [Candidula unifasciata]